MKYVCTAITLLTAKLFIYINLHILYSLISETAATPSSISDADLQISKKLQLPIDFFAYKQAVPCEGCHGCNSDDFKFPEVKDINLDIVDENPLPLTMPFKQKSRNNDNILKQSSFSFGNSTPIKIADTPKNIFSNVSPSQGKFSQLVFGPPANSPATSMPGQSIFGNNQTSTVNAPTSIFGNSSIAPINKLENTDSTTAVPVSAANSFSFALDSEKSASKGFSFGSTLFGSSSTSTTATSNIFGTKSTESSASQKSFLAEPIISSPAVKIETSPAPTGGLYGSVQPITNAEQTLIFGGKASFGKKGKFSEIFNNKVSSFLSISILQTPQPLQFLEPHLVRRRHCQSLVLQIKLLMNQPKRVAVSYHLRTAVLVLLR